MFWSHAVKDVLEPCSKGHWRTMVPRSDLIPALLWIIKVGPAAPKGIKNTIKKHPVDNHITRLKGGNTPWIIKVGDLRWGEMLYARIPWIIKVGPAAPKSM